MKRRYGLPQANVQGMDHTLAYRALVEAAIDVTELYTTDARDRPVRPAGAGATTGASSPPTRRCWLYRADLASAHPAVVARFARLEGRISEREMQRMNAAVQDGASGARRRSRPTSCARARRRCTASRDGDALVGGVLADDLEHLLLVVPSLLAAVLVAVPLGVLAARRPRAGTGRSSPPTGVLQTIPSLALLLFMIPVMMWLVGKGPVPAGDRGAVPLQPAADRAQHATPG